MSIGSYTPGATYGVPQSAYGAATGGYSAPSQGGAAATTGYGSTDSYNPTPGVTTSGPYGSDVPVQNAGSSMSLFGGLLGAVGGGFGAFKLATMFAKTRTIPGLVIGGIVGLGALIGGFFGKKLTGG
jgi:hypothetical protein